MSRDREVAYTYIDAVYLEETEKAVLVGLDGDSPCWIPLAAIEDPLVILKARPGTVVEIAVSCRFATRKGWL